MAKLKKKAPDKSKKGSARSEQDKINFSSIELKWQRAWEQKRAFSVKEDRKKKKMYVLEMFPYPSGTGLHMGHVFNYTIGDIQARFLRMNGFNVLYPMGYDSFGLPAENAAIKAKIHPREYTEKAIENFVKQQYALGLSYDWSRMIKTSDPEYYKWNQYLFLQFFKQGLVYRKKASVNWCPECNTVLANEQVHNGKCWRHTNTDVQIKQLEQWFIKSTKYADELLEKLNELNWPDKIKLMQKNWIGRSEGAEILFKIKNELWGVFTTRPDTLFGVTFLVISLHHPRLQELVSAEQKKEVEMLLKKSRSTKQEDIEQMEKEGAFTGSYAIHPLTGEKIPVWTGNFVLAEYGSGMVMAVPAHDERDLEFAKKYNLGIKPVIAKGAYARSYLMGGENISDEDLKKIGIQIIETQKDGGRKIEIPLEALKKYENIISEKLNPGFWNEYVGGETVFLFKHKNGKIDRYVLSDTTEKKIDKLAAEFNNEEWDEVKRKKKVWEWLTENNWYHDILMHSDEGMLINSNEFNGLLSTEARWHIIKALEEKGLGSKRVQYKMRDWLISRQRYWGTPIPMIYCDRCGIIPVPEKDLPVALPESVKFGKGNPLESNKKFVEVKCPKCRKKARRETDTMDTFFDSSWYYLRFCDPHDLKKPFDAKIADYWMPIDHYIGGAEHACMHLIYARFFSKALRDSGHMGKDISEPFTHLFNQGMIHGEDGYVMSKSRGNVIDPTAAIKDYGADTLRFFLVSMASPDKDTAWSSQGVEGVHRFIKRICSYIKSVKIGESSLDIVSKIHDTIHWFSDDIASFKYNLATIRLRELFERMEFQTEIARHDLESFVKMLSLICPHLAEEFWHEKLKNNSFVALASWPLWYEKKIDKRLEAYQSIIEKTVSDIANLVKLVREKNRQEPNKVYIYVQPNEKHFYNADILKRRVGKNVEIFAVNEKQKYDPQNKSQKARPERPAIYLE
jgi:leucyl-tRNA synthetase